MGASSPANLAYSDADWPQLELPRFDQQEWHGAFENVRRRDPDDTDRVFFAVFTKRTVKFVDPIEAYPAPANPLDFERSG